MFNSSIFVSADNRSGNLSVNANYHTRSPVREAHYFKTSSVRSKACMVIVNTFPDLQDFPLALNTDYVMVFESVFFLAVSPR